MNLKHFLYAIASLIFVIALSSCNNDSEYTVDAEQSPEGRIVSFAIDAKPQTPMDSITYPALKSTKFMVENKGIYHISNADPLPVNTEIRTLKVTIGYASSTHARTDLIYPTDSTEYPREWNETDSVKFFKIKDTFYPQFKVVAPSGYERTYRVDINIYDQDPDEIKWSRAKNGEVDFNLEIKGETKVILNADKSQFIAFTNDKNKIHAFTSPVESPIWTDMIQGGATLPTATILVKSLHATDEIYVMVTSDGWAYTSPIDVLNWTAHDIKIQSIVGLLPELPATKSAPLNEFLITYLNGDKLVYAKTKNFSEILEVEVTNRVNNEVLDGFPEKNFSSLQRTTSDDNYLVVTGGVYEDKTIIEGIDNKNKSVKRSWMIRNISLANTTEIAKVSIYPGQLSQLVPFDTQITSFTYDDGIYAISSDDLSLYSSATGDVWTKNKKQILDKDMVNMNLPSVVVDNENYMWVFGGVSNDNTNTPTYSQEIWKGRMNKLEPKN